MQDFEFTIQEGNLFILQSRNGKRTPWAALVIAVDMVNDGLLDIETAFRRIKTYDLEKIERKRIVSGVKDCLDTIDFLDAKIQEMDSEIKILASNDKYVKHLITIPGISYYAELLISSEIADINRFPDCEHLSSYVT